MPRRRSADFARGAIYVVGFALILFAAYVDQFGWLGVAIPAGILALLGFVAFLVEKPKERARAEEAARREAATELSNRRVRNRQAEVERDRSAAWIDPEIIRQRMESGYYD